MNDINNNTSDYNLNTGLHARFKFHHEFHEILKNNEKILSDIWILNEIIFPFKSDSKKQPIKFNDLLKFSPPLNDYKYHTNQSKSKSDTFENGHTKENSLKANNKQTPTKKSAIHSFVALNKEGHLSPPLIIFPKNELISDMSAHNLNDTTCIEQNQHGTFDDLSLFFKWLRFFVNDKKSKNEYNSKLVLLMNSFLHSILFANVDEHDPLMTQMNSFCRNEKIFFLFYPVEENVDVFNRNVFEAFKEEWEEVWPYCVRRRDPNSQVTFVMAYNQAWRLLCNSNDLIKGCFEEILGLKKQKEFAFGITSKMEYEYVDQTSSVLESAENALKTLDTSIESIEYDEEEKEHNVEHSNLNLSEQETGELVEWIDSLSSIGSICIKKSFQNELHLHLIQDASSNLNSDQLTILNEKNWQYFSAKNRSKFKYGNSFGLINEHDYLAKWNDIDSWRLAYSNYTRNVCNIQSPSELWTLDVLYFPYKNQKIKDPKKDIEATQSAVSVIFSYNASGDNLEPFFVFPMDFSSIATNSTQYLFTKNGHIDSHVFELWLLKRFLPYATSKNKDKMNLILYQGRLPIVNSNVTKYCNSHESRVKLFAITREELIPGDFLFSKIIRGRKTDLLKIYWQKTVSNFDSSLNLKCSSTEEFFNLFLDSFQNCMEEINRSDDSSSSSKYLPGNPNMSKFELKMINSFYHCKFWPVI